MEMSKDLKELTRRKFLELTAVGAAGVAASSMGVPSVFADTPKRGGTLTCGMTFLIQAPDPQRRTGTWARQFMALSYEGLTTPVSIAERMRISREKGPDAVPDVKPMLADSWEIEKEGMRYVFHLKKGVKFHNGKEFDSGDVKWSWERIKDPVNRCQARKLLTMYLKTIETPDRYTIVANMERPYAAFLIANAWCNTSILPKDIIPKGMFWGEAPFKAPTLAPPGTGPFKTVGFQQKHEHVLEAYEDYRVPGLPYLDKIIYKVISKDLPRTMAMRGGDVDYAFGMEPNWVTKVLKGKEDKLHQPISLEKEGLVLFRYLNDATLTIYLNAHDKKNTPFTDVRVRQALDYCIDREKLTRTLYGNQAVPMGQGFHPDTSPWGFKDIKPKQPDIEKAKKLMKEAGYPNGLDVEFKITPTWGKNDIMAQIVQQMARPAGFRIKITPQVGIQYWRNLRTYNYQMFVFTLPKEDPMNRYYSILHTDPAKPYLGYSYALGVKDPIMDELLEDMAGEIDIQKRKAKFKKVVLRCNEQSYVLPYLKNIITNAWSSKLKNFKPWNYFCPEEAFKEAWI
jgi:peptide/nickel transport system substrate-binding protein